jgi:hypothetical protein
LKAILSLCGAWLIFSPALSFALSPSQLSRTPGWRHLLHYKDHFLFGPQSQEAGAAFFFSPFGQGDPEAELTETLAAFQNSAQPEIQKAALCSFPARRHFLEQALSLQFAHPECADYDEWKRGLGAKGASLVYSSAFPNNPAAMFGHVLLRLDRDPARKGQSGLMSYSVSYSANIPQGTNDLHYTVYGLLGGFIGQFSIAPYYTQVNDYTSAEMRDLWEYPLRLSSRQVDFLVDHLWELYAHAYFDYYFFSQNCATQQLALLQAAVPDQPILDGMPWYTLPVDAIHHLKKLGLVGEPAHRPSAKKIFLANQAALTGPERIELKEVIEDPKKIEATGDAHVLDAAAAFWNYRKFLQQDLIKTKEQATLHRILIARAKLGAHPPLAPEIPGITQPDLGHYTSAAAPVFAYADQEYRVGLRYRLGMHDLLDSELGFEPFSQIDYLNIYAYYVPKKNVLRLGEVRLFDATSLYPLAVYDHKFSWKLSLRSEQPLKTFCDSCQKQVLEGGGGLSAFGFSDHDLWYALLSVRAGYSARQTPYKWDIGPGLQSGLLYRFSPVHRANLEAKAEWDFNRAFQQSMFWSYSYAQAYSFSQRFELRGKLAYLARPDSPERRAELQASLFF